MSTTTPVENTTSGGPVQHIELTPVEPTDVSFSARMQWPYLSHLMIGLRNGREAGCWIAGHLFGRAMHGEKGLRLALPPDQVDGAVTALVAAGVTVQKHSERLDTGEGDPRVTIDCWVQS